MTDLIVHPARQPLRGVLPCPPDAGTVELALIVGGLSRDRCRIAAPGLPRLHTPRVLGALGLEAAQDGRGAEVRGRGRRALRAPAEALVAGSDPEVIGALAGMLAAQRFASVLEVARPDAALAVPLAAMARVLRARGARIEGVLDPERPHELAPPLRIDPAIGALSEARYELRAGERAGKAAALVSGLLAAGPTLVIEPVVAGDRLERLLAARGIELDTAGAAVALAPLSRELEPFEAAAPGDSDRGALLLAAALAVEDSAVGVRALAAGRSRRGWLTGLVHAGVAIREQPRGERLGEPCADVLLGPGRPRRPLLLGAELGAAAGVTLPTAAALAASLPGASELDDVPDWRRDRAETLRLLASFGIHAEPSAAGIRVVSRTGRLPAACFEPRGQPALAMAATVLALRADGPTRVRGADCIVASFPRFVGSLRALGAHIELTPP